MPNFNLNLVNSAQIIIKTIYTHNSNNFSNNVLSHGNVLIYTLQNISVDILSSDLSCTYCLSQPHILQFSRSIFKEHNIINRNISYLTLCCNSTLIGHNKGFFDIVILVLNKIVQRAVDGVILARFNLNGDSGKAVVVVNKIVDLALAAVVIIEQLIAVRDQLACYYAFIDRAEIDTFFIIQHSADIVPVKKARQEPHIVEIELEQVFADRLC